MAQDVIDMANKLGFERFAVVGSLYTCDALSGACSRYRHTRIGVPAAR